MSLEGTRPLKRKSSDPVFGPNPLVPNRAPWSNAPWMTQAQTQQVAAALRRKLYEESEQDWERRPHNSTVAEANLLLTLTRGPPQAPERDPLVSAASAARAWKARCGRCERCLRTECGRCPNCLDKRKFGGPGLKKKACMARGCLRVEAQSHTRLWCSVQKTATQPRL